MVVRKRLDPWRSAIGSLLLAGSYVGCFPDLDGLTAGGPGAGDSGAGIGGAMTGGAGTDGATGGSAGDGDEGGAGAGAGTSTGGTDTGGNGSSGGGTTSQGGKGGGGKGGSTGTGGTGTAGKGGNAGASGGAGAGGAGAGGAGTGGAGAGGAGAGGAGAGGAAGQAGGCSDPMAGVTATGVERLTVPLMAINEGQRFNVQNRTSPSMPFDLAGATVTVRAYAPCAIGGNLSIFFRSPSTTESPATKIALSTLTGGFVDIPVVVPAVTGSFDPAMVDIVRIEVEADPQHGYYFQSPATVVYLDSVISSNGTVTHPFNTDPVNLDFQMSGARPLTGSSFVWLSVYP